LTVSRLGLAIVTLCGLASPALAEGVTFYAGVDATSDYVSNGISQTGGKPALQAYLEVDANGFYAGTWLSNVDFGTNDDVEIDLYLGYRTRFDSGFYLDVGYAHYFYDDSGNCCGSCCGEVKLAGVYPILKNLGLEGYLAFDPVTDNLNKRATLAYALNDQLGLSAAYGETDSNKNQYWQVGASYAFTDYLSADVRYHGAQSGDEGLVLTLSLATTQQSFARLLAAPFGR
jgi:uncharacterized protein (TIGR02001 family)